MLFSEKLVYLRKKSGLTQEALAEALGVSRQSVSKWEAAGAMPEMAKIIEISKYFHVSTDFLLLDSMDPSEDGEDQPAEEALSSVALEDADAYMNYLADRAPKVALAVSLFILSAIPPILAGIADTDAAYTLGIIATLAVVAVGVFLLVYGPKMPDDFEAFDEPVDTAYGVDGVVKKRKENYAPLHSRRLSAGIILCILSAAPMLFSSAAGRGDAFTTTGFAATLCIVAAGVFFIVRTSVIEAGFDKILEQGDYTRRKKIARRRTAPIQRAYYLSMLLIFLALSFYTNKWQWTWILWPGAALVNVICRSIAESIRAFDED